MRALLLVVAAACGGSTTQTPTGSTSRKVETIAPEKCAEEMKARFAIDTSVDPRVCVPLFEAAVSLGPTAVDVVRELKIVRDVRGPCADKCPDLASQLMSDAALAYYKTVPHELHITDAAFGTTRWLGASGDGSAPTQEAVSAYLADLGLDWLGLVKKVQLVAGTNVPLDGVTFGDARVFDAIVRMGPATLMAGTPDLAGLFRHELGHAIQLHMKKGVGVVGYASLTGWREMSSNEIADGYVGGFYANERPIVASRILLGLQRGESDYKPGAASHPTGYAQFDPMEDFAESVRLASNDPVALGAKSPVRLIVAASADVLRDPSLRAYVVPGVTALLASSEGSYSMRVLREKGDALLPEIASLADPRPLPFPADTTVEEREDIESMGLVVKIGTLTFRPNDKAFAELFASARRALEEVREFDKGLEKLRSEN